jgi:hypothetical protein
VLSIDNVEREPVCATSCHFVPSGEEVAYALINVSVNAADLLASKLLLDRTVKPANIVATSIGGHLLRGKSECLELFALERGTTDRGHGRTR